jgi:hypothetical protein
MNGTIGRLVGRALVGMIVLLYLLAKCSEGGT